MRKLFRSALLGGIFILMSGGLAMAAEEAAAGGSYLKETLAIFAGLTISLAATTGAIAQSRAIVAALKGIARNPGASGKIFTPMILGLALIESLVIYALIISFMLLGKI